MSRGVALPLASSSRYLATHVRLLDRHRRQAELYRDLLSALDALTADEPDPIANMANAAALLFEYLPDLNWAGFYRNIGGELVLGPFQGKAACIRIPFGKGVCGAAAASRATRLVAGRARLPRHIACDAASRSELGGADRPCRRAGRRARPRQPEPGAASTRRMPRAARRWWRCWRRACVSPDPFRDSASLTPRCPLG